MSGVIAQPAIRACRHRRRTPALGSHVVEVSLCGESGRAPRGPARAGRMLGQAPRTIPTGGRPMRGLHVPRRAWPLAGVVSIALAGAAVAAAATLTAGTPVQVADNPLAATAPCAPLVAQQTAAGSVNYAGSEVEPYVAADPSIRRISSRASSKTAGTMAARTESQTSFRATAARRGRLRRANRNLRSAQVRRRARRATSTGRPTPG